MRFLHVRITSRDDLFNVKQCIFLIAIIAGMCLPGCRPAYVGVEARPAYRGGGGVDFYYAGRRPYSRRYGALVFRNDRYYYRRGGGWIVYRGPTRAWRRSDLEVRVYR